MRHQRRFGALVASLILAANTLTAQAGPVTACHVISVHDGDTITCEGKRRVQLYAIDAPELKQPFGYIAGDYLRTMVNQRDVLVEEFDIDKYGRTVGIVTLDGKDVGLAMIRAGLAMIYTGNPKFIRYAPAAYFTAQATAKLDSLGVWSLPGMVSPWEFRSAKLHNDFVKRSHTQAAY